MPTPHTHRIGSLKFFYLGGATPPVTLNSPALYLTTFAEGKGEFDAGIKTTDVVSPLAGVNRRVAMPVTEAFPEYKITTSLYNANLEALWYGGVNPTSDTAPATITVGENYMFTGWGLIMEYNVGDVLGVPSMIHAGFRCQLLPDGKIAREPGKPTELTYRVVLIDASNAGIRSQTGA